MFYLYTVSSAACSSTPCNAHVWLYRGCGYPLILSVPALGFHGYWTIFLLVLNLFTHEWITCQSKIWWSSNMSKLCLIIWILRFVRIGWRRSITIHLQSVLVYWHLTANPLWHVKLPSEILITARIWHL